MSNEHLLAGPVLLSRGDQGTRWRLSALFALRGEAEPDDLRVEGISLDVPPRHVAGWRDVHVWRFDFAVTPGDGARTLSYGFADRPPSWSLSLPAGGRADRLAFVSGTGVADGETADSIWRRLATRHAERPFHLLLMGGGQVSGSGLWRDCPRLAAWYREHWAGVSVREANLFNEEMAAEAMDHFMERNIAFWRHPIAAPLLASIPSVMMWDDHDVFAGLSHLDPEQRRTRPVRGAVAVARRWFELFQLGATADALPECVWGGGPKGLTQGLRLGDLGILALDLVSERDEGRMLSPESWEQLPEWLAHFSDCRDLFVISSRPLLLPPPVGPRWVPPPLRVDDGGGGAPHWRAPELQGEWTRLSRLLLGLNEHTGCRVTILSGMEGATGPLSPPSSHPTGFQSWLEAPGAMVRQLVSSAIRPRRPSPLAHKLAERRARAPEEPRQGWRLSLSPSNAKGGAFIRHPNWLAVERHDQGNADALWYTGIDVNAVPEPAPTTAGGSGSPS